MRKSRVSTKSSGLKARGCQDKGADFFGGHEIIGF